MFCWGRWPGDKPPRAPLHRAASQAARRRLDTSASVPADAAVITVIGVCPPQPKPAAATGAAAKPATAAKTPAAKTPPANCKTVITKAQFEKLANALAPNVSHRRSRSNWPAYLPRVIGMSSEAKKEGLDKTEQFERDS